MKKSVETLSTLTLCFLWLEVLQYLLEVDASRGVHGIKTPCFDPV